MNQGYLFPFSLKGYQEHGNAGWKPIYSHFFAWHFSVLTVLIASCRSDIKEPVLPTSEFQLEKGFEITCIAAEPLVVAPVAMQFDDAGRMWVVEMPGYMPNPEGEKEREPTGKIVILEDKDGDGLIDTRKVFIDSLVLPRALGLAYGGLLYAEPPNLWFVEILEDDVPGKKTLVDSAYAVGGNVEHQPNGLLYHPDNWIYNAKSGFRYRLREGRWEKKPTHFRGQWGMTFDAFGRLFYNDNSNQLQGDYLPPGMVDTEGAARSRFVLGQQICTDQRVFPLQPTAVNRGYQPGMLDAGGKLVNVTSACGPLIYLGGAFPTGYEGNAFVCAPEANLVKRNILRYGQDARITGHQAYQYKEFLASHDETFRPVNLFYGPDGAMYVLDLRKGIIQHRTYMSAYLREQLHRKGLDTLQGKGRIYRIAPINLKSIDFQPINSRPAADLIEALGDKNAWIRLRAQQELILRNDPRTVNLLKALVIKSKNPVAVFHALWTLEGLGKLENAYLPILQNPNQDLIVTAIQLAASYPGSDTEPVLAAFEKIATKNNPALAIALASAIGTFAEVQPEAVIKQLETLLERYENDSLFAEALAAGLVNKEVWAMETLKNKGIIYPGHFLFSRLREAVESRKIAPANSFATFTDEMTKGLHLYATYCSGCHRMGGEGIAQVAPPLQGSKTVSGSPERLFHIIWNGWDQPVEVEGRLVLFNNAMPAFKDNPDWTEADVKAVVSFIQNAFSAGK
jgi:mono/diheme cytochrome c family protein